MIEIILHDGNQIITTPDVANWLQSILFDYADLMEDRAGIHDCYMAKTNAELISKQLEEMGFYEEG